MKNKTLIKIISLVLGATFCFGTVGCANEANHPVLPDYSLVADNYDFLAYSPPNKGVYQFSNSNEIVELGPDLRTVEGYTIYKDAGFNMLMLTGTAAYDGTVPFYESETCRAWDNALQAGLDRMVLVDRRIRDLIERKGALISENGDIKSEEQLKEIVKSYLSDYIDKEGFYGLVLRDEPDYTYVKSFGWVCEAIREAANELGHEDIYLNLNLLPYDGMYSRFGAEGQYKSMSEAYEGYVRSFLESTKLKRISVDVYAFRARGISGQFYSTAQLFRRLADEYNVEVSFCLQSFQMFTGSTMNYRAVDKNDMLLEIYSLMSFGFDQFAYYTYQSPDRETSGPWPTDTSFVNVDGTLSNVYYYGKEAMANAQAMSDIILNYKHLGSKFYMAKLANFDNSPYLSGPAGAVKVFGEDGSVSTVTSSLKFNNEYEFEHIDKVVFDNDVVYIAELFDDKNDLYMYMVQNVINPIFGEMGRTAEKITVTFDGDYTHVAELKDGSLNYVELTNGVYEKTLSAGHAVYLIPLK